MINIKMHYFKIFHSKCPKTVDSAWIRFVRLTFATVNSHFKLFRQNYTSVALLPVVSCTTSGINQQQTAKAAKKLANKIL